MQKQIGDVIVTGSPAGASVNVNGKNVGVLPLKPVRVVAGQVRVEVAAPGYKDRSETVVVVGDTQERITMNLRREGAATELNGAVDPASSAPAGGLGPTPPRPAADASSSWGAGQVA